jgi:hypothetical protein
MGHLHDFHGFRLQLVWANGCTCKAFQILYLNFDSDRIASGSLVSPKLGSFQVSTTTFLVGINVRNSVSARPSSSVQQQYRDHLVVSSQRQSRR